jgi:hypothetical protein
MARPFVALLSLFAAQAGSADLTIYAPAPGLEASSHYRVRIRPSGDGSAWRDAFAWQTECNDEEAYFDSLKGWTHAYINFETSVAVEIEISRVIGEPQMLWGSDRARIKNLTFENLTISGKPVTSAEFFKANEFVEGLQFQR